MALFAQGFVDGGYLREISRASGAGLVDPSRLLGYVSRAVRWGGAPPGQKNVALTRTRYYDAWPSSGDVIDPLLEQYWEAVELIPDTDLGFGSVRRGKKRQQKGVDTLMAVDMLVSAFTKVMSVGLLVAGDADFVPVLEEVRRLGVLAVVAAEEESLSNDLRRAADRVVPIGPKLGIETYFPPLIVGRQFWRYGADGKLTRAAPPEG